MLSWHLTHSLICFSILVPFLARTLLQNTHLTLGVLKSPPLTSLNKGKTAVFFLPGILKFDHRERKVYSSSHWMASDSQVRKQSRITGTSWLMGATLLSVNMQSKTTALKKPVWCNRVNNIASLIVIKQLDFPTHNYWH